MATLEVNLQILARSVGQMAGDALRTATSYPSTVTVRTMSLAVLERHGGNCLTICFTFLYEQQRGNSMYQ